MPEFLALFGFPPHPIGAVCVVAFSLLWSLRARRKVRPYLLALQVAIISNVLAAGLIFLRDNITGSFIASVANITVGQIAMFWLIAWLIISLIFLIRARNDSSNIFTRNRNS